MERPQDGAATMLEHDVQERASPGNLALLPPSGTAALTL